ncbi:MAG: hypothetical protein DWQ07_08470 [Chloroflexi bacterium]|nr:MAG: hypothetical protein DWQ07_08470 [Chloroflexota bacterium]MBL1193254.1 hypothetical protein [Chloroflexota bacterium]
MGRQEFLNYRILFDLTIQIVMRWQLIGMLYTHGTNQQDGYILGKGTEVVLDWTLDHFATALKNYITSLNKKMIC